MGAATHCQLYKKVAYSHTGYKEAIFTRLRCKQWSCDDCSRKNAWIWRTFLKEKLPQVAKDWYIVTFTAHPNTRSKQASLQNLRGNIDKLFKRIKRVFGEVNYVRIYERHPTSRAIHAHFLVSGLSPFVAIGYSSKLRPIAFGVLTRSTRNGVWSVKTWFKKIAAAIGIGRICDVRRIIGSLDDAIGYLCKYLTKSQQDLNIKGLRHVQTSKRIGSPPKGEKQVWQTVAYIVSKMFSPNAQITDLNTNKVIDNAYWEVYGYYPIDD